MQVLLLLTLAGGVLRFATLDGQSFWYDEAVTVRLLHMDLGGMLHTIPNSEATPPLYYLLAWLWTKPFGTGEVGLRSLSALVGTAAIPVFYAAATELCSRSVGLVVAALAAFNPLLIWYSQEARSYALLVLLVGLSLWGFTRLLRRPDRTAVVLWAVASALALATHYFAIFLIAPELVWLAAAPKTRRPTLLAAAVVVATGLALLPLALHQRSLDLGGYIDESPLVERVARTIKNLVLGYESPLEAVSSATALLIAAAAGAFALARPEASDRRGVRTAAVLGAAALALPLALALAGADYVQARNLIVAWLPLAVVAGAGLAMLRRRSLGAAGAAVLCALGLASVVGVALEPSWQRDDWRGMAHALGPARSARAVVVGPVNGVVPLEIYLRGLSLFPPAGAKVREIALMYPVQRLSGGLHPAPPPRLAAPPIPGFRVVERRETESYTLVLLRARTPVLVRDLALLSLSHAPMPGEEPTIRLQRAGRTG
ncbi:MAG TPA: glycosyltransferase family 39 protein [Thermoleophilaceae bacterium]|nr:glycosyltransferase family 39 protein [Thermoleophilaceae bacterium]